MATAKLPAAEGGLPPPQAADDKLHSGSEIPDIATEDAGVTGVQIWEDCHDTAQGDRLIVGRCFEPSCHLSLRPTAPAAPLPPGSPLIGRPDNNPAAAKLAPVPSPPLATAADKVPVDKLKAPKGFNIELYASGMPNARSLALSDKGTVFVGSRLQDKVYAITNKDGKRQVHVLVSGLYRPNGVAFKDGTLYIAELSQISKIEHVDDKIDASPKPVVIYNDLPKDEAHGWKFLAIGPDNKLYFEVGQPGNNVLHDKDHGQLRRINLDGSGAEVIAYGIRNTVGFDWNPKTKELYFTDNGRDWMSEDLPNDELNRITKLGQDFGAPYCYRGNVADPEFGWGHSCSEFVPPVALMGPHAAAIGMRFYTGTMFPAEYRDQIFVARHGSWNRTIKFGSAATSRWSGSTRTAASSRSSRSSPASCSPTTTISDGRLTS
jgi:glucose/arabinose dehydrogenase